MIKLKQLLPECNECGRDWNHGHDHEAGMAKNELRDMISNASKIDQMIGESDNLPGWASAYISLAADYMHSVAEYLGGESSRMQEPGPGYAMNEGDDRVDPMQILKAITVEYPMNHYSRHLLAFMKDKAQLDKIANGADPTQVFSDYLRMNENKGSENFIYKDKTGKSKYVTADSLEGAEAKLNKIGVKFDVSTLRRASNPKIPAPTTLSNLSKRST